MSHQAYLNAMGIDLYAPRWHLPHAPQSVVNIFYQEEYHSKVNEELESSVQIDNDHSQVISNTGLLDMRQALTELFEVKPNPSKRRIEKIIPDRVLDANESKSIAPFSLSIWRPLLGLLILDFRSSKDALPVELLLSNLLRVVKLSSFRLDEEVLHWPMVENRYAPRLLSKAQQELQTWLMVENDLRPISELWLMGSAAQMCFFPEHEKLEFFSQKQIQGVGLFAHILPSLKELLLDATLKPKLFNFLLESTDA